VPPIKENVARGNGATENKIQINNPQSKSKTTPTTNPSSTINSTIVPTNVINQKEPENKLKKLDIEAPQDKWFVLNNYNIKSIKELISVLEIIDDDTFCKYVNEQKNDFANWIRDVFLMQDLAKKIYSAKSRQDMIRLILN
jgi:hypothetical protein